MLEVDQTKKYYRGAGGVVHAVEDVALEVDSGEFVALFGPSGSGKTTLLLLIAGLLRPDAGTISFQGKDIEEMSMKERLWYRRRHLGFVFQSFDLIPGLSAVENVMLPRLISRPPRTEVLTEAKELLDRIGLSSRANHRADHLSGGEQQRVAIARALTGQPSLVLADEPTGNLDTKSGERVLTLLHELCSERGTAVILVTHDQEALNYADRSVTMRDGRLEAAKRATGVEIEIEQAPA